MIETSPSERSRLERGSTVTLVVSRGPRTVEVPDVVGKDRDEAERLLEARGLQVSFTEREDENKEPGTVLAMSPAAGTEAERDATVTLTIAKEPKQVAVPDVLGDDVNDAVDALEEAGLPRPPARGDGRRRPTRTASSATQDPPAGEKRDKGSRVIITVGRFEPENLDPDPGATPAPSPTP